MSVTLTIGNHTTKEYCVNLSNTNFRHMMTALGYDSAQMDWVGRLDPRDLLARVARCQLAIAEGHEGEFTRSAVDRRIEVGTETEGRMAKIRMTDLGADAAYVTGCLTRLAILASRAIARGATVNYY